MSWVWWVVVRGSHWHVWIYKLRGGNCGSTTPVVICLDEQHPRSKFFMCTQVREI